MSNKFLIGFELYVEEELFIGINSELKFELLEYIRNYTNDYFNIGLIRFNQEDNIQIYCTIEPIKVSKYSSGNDKITKSVIEEVKKIYLDIENEIREKDLYLWISPMYFSLKDEDIIVYRKISNFIEKRKELNNTSLWYKYYGRICYINNVIEEAV